MFDWYHCVVSNFSPNAIISRRFTSRHLRMSMACMEPFEQNALFAAEANL